MLRRVSKKIIPHTMITNLEIEWALMNNKNPILVYQMGKVGSSTVTKTLKKALNTPVYHVHFLTDDGLKMQAEAFLKYRHHDLPVFVKQAQAIKSKIEQKTNNKWKIITLVRDPIARDISDLFQNFQRLLGEHLDSSGKIKDINKIIELLQAKFANYNQESDFASTWFDRELKTRFNVDVYDYPFDQEQGFSIINHHQADILVMRLENLNQSLNQACQEFLGIHLTEQDIANKNVSQDKQYFDDYKYVVKNIIIPRETCQKIYASKYVRHFYTQEMIDKFISKWSKK